VYLRRHTAKRQEMHQGISDGHNNACSVLPSGLQPLYILPHCAQHLHYECKQLSVTLGGQQPAEVGCGQGDTVPSMPQGGAL
jgi:hypothetical protein